MDTMRTLTRTALATLVVGSLLASAPAADAARHHHHKAHKAHKAKVVKVVEKKAAPTAPAPTTAQVVPARPEASSIPYLNQGRCQMYNARYIESLGGWYYVCG